MPHRITSTCLHPRHVGDQLGFPSRDVGVTESFEASGGPEPLVHDPDREPRLPASPIQDGAGRSSSSAPNVDYKY